jgi:hypothetical protein
MRVSRVVLTMILAGLIKPADTLADLVADSNKAVNPPAFDDSSNKCVIELRFKPTPLPGQTKHAFLVISESDGKQTEVRGGPQKESVSDASSKNASGNPFACDTDHKFGAVVPYIGRHGKLGKGEGGEDVFSPDGEDEDISGRATISQAVLKSSCALANCLVSSVKQSASSCKNYVLGAGWMRNSNTIISTALTTCGVNDPKPKDISAPGWGEEWDNPADR